MDLPVETLGIATNNKRNCDSNKSLRFLSSEICIGVQSKSRPSKSPASNRRANYPKINLCQRIIHQKSGTNET